MLQFDPHGACLACVMELSSPPDPLPHSPTHNRPKNRSHTHNVPLCHRRIKIPPGSQVQFIPTSVIRGFLACVGMEILGAALENATGSKFQEGIVPNLDLVLQTQYWLLLGPALAVGLPLYACKRWNLFSTSTVVPFFLTVPIAVFFAVLWLTETSLREARMCGWLYPETPRGSPGDHWRLFELGEVNVMALLGTWRQVRWVQGAVSVCCRADFRRVRRALWRVSMVCCR